MTSELPHGKFHTLNVLRLVLIVLLFGTFI